MTAADVLTQAAVAGCEVYLKDGKPVVRGSPNAALLAALKEHRAGIVALLGGAAGPEWCEGHPDPDDWKKLGRVVVCRAWVYEAADSEAFCNLRGCPFRRRARG